LFIIIAHSIFFCQDESTVSRLRFHHSIMFYVSKQSLTLMRTAVQIIEAASRRFGIAVKSG
ncbi:MAG: hypothetical protein II779_10680, partial [Clostridia bacterium]|nr:hypothetical protein [Clostridia bacterium]